jgi:hypothetical protein
MCNHSRFADATRTPQKTMGLCAKSFIHMQSLAQSVCNDSRESGEIDVQ